ncbi:hypothetical protein V1505DRAFT_387450 [Lipomyces doorenjongii]
MEKRMRRNALARSHGRSTTILMRKSHLNEIELEIESDCEFEELEVPDEELAMIQSLNIAHLNTGSRPGNSRTSQYRKYTQGKDTTCMKSMFEYFKRHDNGNLEAVALPT